MIEIMKIRQRESMFLLSRCMSYSDESEIIGMGGFIIEFYVTF